MLSSPFRYRKSSSHVGPMSELVYKPLEHYIVHLNALNYYWLVVSTILKNMKVNGKDYPIYYGK